MDNLTCEGFKKLETWGFRPTHETKLLMAKAIERVVRQARKVGMPLNPNRLRSALINEAIRTTYGDLAGKCEGAPVPIPILIAEARNEARNEAAGVGVRGGALVEAGAEAVNAPPVENGNTCAG